MKLIRKKNEQLSQESMDTGGCSLLDMAVEVWRLDRTMERVLQRMDSMDAERFASQYRWFRKKVDAVLTEGKLRIVDLTGKPYDIGMAVHPLNLDEFDGEELMVAQMIEPIIMSEGNVVQAGTVLLGTKA